MSSSPNPFDAPAADVGYGPYSGQEDMTDVVLADRGKRFAGSLIDNFIFIPTILPSIGLLAADMEEVAIAVGAVLILSLLGYQWFLISTTGQSLAKKWLGMKIIREDGSDVDFVSGVILRIWTIFGMGFIPFVGSFIGIIDAAMIFGDDYQCLHDKIAKTKVIDLELTKASRVR